MEQQKVTDPQLTTRVRSIIEEQVSHPRTIAVNVESGTVTLGGPVLASELADLLAAIEAEPGVKGVLNHLEVHESVDEIPEQDGSETLTAEPAHHAISSAEDALAPAPGAEEGAFQPETI